MANLDRYYDLNPQGVIDQNQWDERSPEVNLAFRRQSVYTPLIDWDMITTGAQTQIEFELLEGDVDHNEIPLTANYIDSFGMDSRYRTFTTARYGGKVQLHKSSNVFQQWKIGGTRDWRPLLRGMLGDHVVRLNEALARKVWFQGPKSYWTFAGSSNTNFGELAAGDKFSLAIVNQWKLRLGNTGSPVIPGDSARAQVAIIPPGATYDIMSTIAAASANEAALWRDAHLYADGLGALNFEIGTFKGVRFVEAPSDRFGINPNVLYNAGVVTHQHGVTRAIKQGDGSPDPETTKVDSTWAVGQKNVTHYIQLEDIADGDYAVNDIVTIHVARTSGYGVSNGVDPFDGRTIYRRVVVADHTLNRLSFDRPIMQNYNVEFASTGSVDETTPGAFYAYVTKGVNIGFALVLGSRGGVKGKVVQPIQFYNPVAVDDFESVWRFSYDQILGYNMAEPNLFELHFFSVSIPKVGGIG